LGLGGVTGSGGFISDGSGGTPTGDGGNSQAGTSGAGGAGGVSTQPIGADGLLDTGATHSLVVSQDEHHVAFMRDYLPVPPCGKTGEELNARSTGVGTLLVATIANDGTVAVRVVGQGVKFDSVGFSADSKSMAYVDGYDACSRGGVLKIAAADGSSPRTIESVSINFDEQIVGNTLLFLRPGTGLVEGQVYAVWLPDGTPISTVSSPSTYSQIWVSPDGRRAGYFDATWAAVVLDVSTGASHQVASQTNAVSNGTIVWSPDGAFLALTYYSPGTDQTALAVAAAGDTQGKILASNNVASGPVFSPDSSRLAYQPLDSAGAPQLVVHPLVGGTDVHVPGLPDPGKTSDWLLFSPDGAVVLVIARDNPSGVISLYAASAVGSGSLKLITSNVGGLSLSNVPGSANGATAMPPGDGNVAVELNSGSTQVFSLNGGDSHQLPGVSPVYEPNAAQPRLLLSQSNQAPVPDPVPAFLLASTDGTNMKAVLLPTGASPWGPVLQWMGHTVVGVFSPSSTGTLRAVYAWSGDSSSPTLLAAGPDTYAWAPIPVPTRLFYARAAASSAGSAGLWMVTIP
jgi:hypothetical protein